MKFKLFLMSVFLLCSSVCFAQSHVASLNSMTGAISILPGSGITITNASGSITVSASDAASCTLTPVGQTNVCGAGTGTSYYSSPVLRENIISSSGFLNQCYANAGADGNTGTSRGTFMCLSTESNGYMGIFTQLSSLSPGVGANILFDGVGPYAGSLEMGVNNTDGSVIEWWVILNDAMYLVNNGKGACIMSATNDPAVSSCIGYNGTTLPGITNIPTTSSDTCSTGKIAWDTNYVYVCVATNSWKRTVLSSW